ncbi:MAG: hypothetical protein Q9216_006031 [Gyalolechia sp. 2 TL-2023]
MEDFLIPVRTTKAALSPKRNDREHIIKTNHETSTSFIEDIRSPEQTLDILKSHPSQEALSNVLRWLHGSKGSKDGFSIDSQTPQAAKIIHALVNDVLPDHWSSIREGVNRRARKMRDLVTCSLSNVAGISALINRMRSLIGQDNNEEEKSKVRLTGRPKLLEEALSILESTLEPDSFVSSIWSDLTALFPTTARRCLIWKEVVALLAGGRVLSVASEADGIVTKEASTIRERSWLSEGSKHSAWIGRNLKHFLSSSVERDVDKEKAWAQMLERALTIGHIDQVVAAAYDELIHGDSRSATTGHRFTMALKGSTRRNVLHSLLRVLTKVHLSSLSALPGEEANIRVSGVAALLHEFVRDKEGLLDVEREWLSGDGVVQDFQIRRAVIASLAIHIGYVHRKDPLYLAQISQSSLYLNAISNRIAASSPRASVLGMYVGTAVSQLVDPVDKRMNFSSEELATAEGRRYLGLTTIQDRVGSVEDLKHRTVATKITKGPAQQASGAHQIKPPSSNSQAAKGSKIISIEQIESESNSDDDDLPTYAKPDSDASDSDEDPTVINRDKPTAPVYINDLISSLRDTENYDRHTLALTHASSLIRRKSSFGTEVTDNVRELASILTSLPDKWNFENFQEFRLQAMIAVLVAQPLEMGQWFSSTYFNGDFSISQRAAVLTTLGLGARELAGYGNEDAALTKSNQVSRDKAFPSKQLPQKLHALYASKDMEPLATASQKLEQSILRPMALNAADALTGPNALKIRTFSSRMEVEKKRTKPIPNALAKVVADGFFLPLTGRWSTHVQG